MSERFTVKYSEKFRVHMVHDNGEPIDNVPVMNLLNSQAETIEVLREMIDELKRRIAALEGE